MRGPNCARLDSLCGPPAALPSGTAGPPPAAGRLPFLPNHGRAGGRGENLITRS